MKVFISYAHKDIEAAKELADKLKERGVQPWLDEDNIKPGVSWAEQIKAAVVDSGTVVVILGEGEPSPNVLVEAGMAMGQGKPVLPVVVGENPYTGIFSNLQQVYVYGHNGLDAAADQIARFVDDSS